MTMITGDASAALPMFDIEPEPVPWEQASGHAEIGGKVTWWHYRRNGCAGLRTGTIWDEAPIQARHNGAWWAVPDSPEPADLRPAVYVQRRPGCCLYATDSGPDLNTGASR